MNKLPRNVWVLTSGMALMMSSSSLTVFVGGIVGNQLAPGAELATLPVAAIIIGTALFTIPVALLMKKVGRRFSFLLIAMVSIFISLFAAYSIYSESFYLLCSALAMMGISVASLNQFRFAAMESVSTPMIPKAASTVLLGGIAAAFIGPEIAVQGKELLAIDFSGSFILLAFLFFLGFFILLRYKDPAEEVIGTNSSAKSFSEILKQPLFWVAVVSGMVGYAVMSFIMTATPVSMHVMDGHSLHDTKWVIQSHIVAMFLPSLFTPRIIAKFGIKWMMLAGVAAFVICIGIGYSGHSLHQYWISLILLGIGWNFLFIGGTTLLPRTYTSQEKFKVQALNEFLIFGTQAIAALSAGYIVHAIGWENLLLITLPILLIPIGLIVFNFKKL